MALNERQTTSRILMVRPANFSFNEETAGNNAFQKNDSSLDKEEVAARAVVEFDRFVEALRAAGVEVMVVNDTEWPVKSDAVFPNNWITTHEDGTLVTYPMFAPNRRLERREDVVGQLRQAFCVKKIIQLEAFEEVNQYLEGTGSMIFDRPNGLAYACESPRTHTGLLDRFCELMQMRKVAFHAVDSNGQDIYHTNVMMALGESFVVICLDTVKNEAERSVLTECFKTTAKEIIEIDLRQMMAFAGNMLQLRTKTQEPLLVMSAQAYRSLREEQIRRIEKHTRILHAPLDIIETYGGGSARCMIAEIFLPPKTEPAA